MINFVMINVVANKLSRHICQFCQKHNVKLEIDLVGVVCDQITLKTNDLNEVICEQL